MGKLNCRCPIWVWGAILIGVAVIITGGSLLAVMQTSITNQQRASYQQLGSMIESDMQQSANSLLANLYEAAIFLIELEPMIKNCQMGDNYQPTAMIELFNGLSQDETRQLGSLGFISKAPNTTNGKLSWQVALGFGCPKYIYAYAEATTYPLFLGFCASSDLTIDRNTTAYNGSDWGLKPEEADLLIANVSANRTIHLPIFALIDRLMLTVERTVSCPGKVGYGAVFAEQSLGQLDRALSQITSQEDTPGTVAFIYERQTQFLISSSLPNLTQSVAPNGTVSRVKISETNNGVLREIYGAVANNNIETENWWIVSTPFINQDIDWILVSAIPVGGYVQTIRNISGMAIGIAVAIIVSVLLISILVTRWTVSLRLKSILERAKKYVPLDSKSVENDIGSTSYIEELAELDEYFK